jgi:hypothetical protein
MTLRLDSKGIDLSGLDNGFVDQQAGILAVNLEIQTPGLVCGRDLRVGSI